MTQAKAVLFSRLSNSDINNGHTLANTSNKLREYAKNNGLVVIDSFEAIEDTDIGESRTLWSILDFIDKQETRITIVSYNYTRYDNTKPTGQRLQRLI